MLSKAVCLVAFLVVISTARKLPDFVKTCKWDPATLNECFKDSFNDIIPRLGKGIPEMNLRAIDPAIVEKVDIKYGSGGSVNLDAVLTNLKLYGCVNAKLEKAIIDTDKKILDLDVNIPDIYLESDYKGTGKVLLIALDSNGVMRANLTNLNAKVKVSTEVVDKDGKEFLHLVSTDIDINADKFHINFENLFPNKDINDNTNQLFNENIKDLFQELKPIILDTVKSIVIDAIDNVLRNYPFGVLFPK